MNELWITLPNNFRKLFERYKASSELEKAEQLVSHQKADQTTEKSQEKIAIPKYSDVKEPIKLKSLDIEIRGNEMSKGTQKSQLNPTDRWLVYFLYYKFLANKDECFTLGRFASEMKAETGEKTEVYIKNRITEINKALRELIVKGKTSIPSFIKHESRRGYHLNPKLLTVTK
jgi:hypothetical protein